MPATAVSGGGVVVVTGGTVVVTGGRVVVVVGSGVLVQDASKGISATTVTRMELNTIRFPRLIDDI
jgi:phosphoribosylamine-glycine ligase